MKTPRVKRIAKAICVALAVIAASVLAYRLLSPLWFWIAWEVVAALCVAIGCAFEWWLVLAEVPKDDDAARKRNREARVALMVTIGVSMELLALAHVIPESLRLEARIEEMRKENLEAELALSPRRFKDWRRAGDRLAKFAGTGVTIEYFNDHESHATAQMIFQPLKAANWNIIAMRAGPDNFFDGVTVHCAPDEEESRPARDAADALVAELNKTGMLARFYGGWYSLPPKTLLIRVGVRPSPEAIRREKRDGKLDTSQGLDQ